MFKEGQHLVSAFEGIYDRGRNGRQTNLEIKEKWVKMSFQRKGKEVLSREGYHATLELSCNWDFLNGKILKSDLLITRVVYVH